MADHTRYADAVAALSALNRRVWMDGFASTSRPAPAARRRLRAPHRQRLPGHHPPGRGPPGRAHYRRHYAQFRGRQEPPDGPRRAGRVVPDQARRSWNEYLAAHMAGARPRWGALPNSATPSPLPIPGRRPPSPSHRLLTEVTGAVIRGDLGEPPLLVSVRLIEQITRASVESGKARGGSPRDQHRRTGGGHRERLPRRHHLEVTLWAPCRAVVVESEHQHAIHLRVRLHPSTRLRVPRARVEGPHRASRRPCVRTNTPRTARSRAHPCLHGDFSEIVLRGARRGSRPRSDADAVFERRPGHVDSHAERLSCPWTRISRAW